MSVGSDLAESFLAPLRGRATIFRVPDRRSNTALAALLTSSLGAAKLTTRVLDSDALYASGAGLIAGGAVPVRASLFLSDIGETVDASITAALSGTYDAFIVDGVNTLFHSLSWSTGGAAGRKLTFMAALLSFLARTNNTIAALVVYERPKQYPVGHGRKLSDLGDATVYVDLRKDSVSLKCERGTLWPRGTFELPIPSGW